jgi:hypothetical protein
MVLLIYCRFGTYFFPMATKIVQVGPGSVVKLLPGSGFMIQDYGSADPDPNTVKDEDFGISGDGILRHQINKRRESFAPCYS